MIHIHELSLITFEISKTPPTQKGHSTDQWSSKAEHHPEPLGVSPFQLMSHPEMTHFSSLAGSFRSLLQPGHPLAGQAAVELVPGMHSFCALKPGPNPLYMFSATSLLLLSLQAQRASALIIHSPIHDLKSCWFPSYLHWHPTTRFGSTAHSLCFLICYRSLKNFF